jgi:hypothetical protein
MHYGSTACFYGTEMSAIATTFDNNSMTTNGKNYNHVNNSLWLYSGSTCLANEAEIGFKNNFLNDEEYGWYTDEVINHVETDHFISYSSADGSSHSYEIEYIGSGDFETILDNNSAAIWGGLGDGGCEAQTGLETTALGSSFTAAAFNHTPLKWEDASDTWHSGWSTSDYWIDNPCGSAPCLNGTFVGGSNNEWSDSLEG